MKETKTCHVMHDQDGNIKSLFVNSSNVGAEEMITPASGYSVARVNVGDLKLPQEAQISLEEDLNSLRELMKHYRVDTSALGSLIKKGSTKK